MKRSNNNNILPVTNDIVALMQNSIQEKLDAHNNYHKDTSLKRGASLFAAGTIFGVFLTLFICKYGCTAHHAKTTDNHFSDDRYRTPTDKKTRSEGKQPFSSSVRLKPGHADMRALSNTDVNLPVHSLFNFNSPPKLRFDNDNLNDNDDDNDDKKSIIDDPSSPKPISREPNNF